jgi:hypothetical protein
VELNQKRKEGGYGITGKTTRLGQRQTEIKTRAEFKIQMYQTGRELEILH